MHVETRSAYDITEKITVVAYTLCIVQNLIPFQNLGLQSKTDALFQKMIIDFFVAFYPYFTIVKLFEYGALYGAPRIAISRVINRKTQKSM